MFKHTYNNTLKSERFFFMRKILLLLYITVSLFAETHKSEFAHEVSLLIGNSENGYGDNIDSSFASQMQYQYNGFDFAIKPEIAFVYSKNIPIYNNAGDSRTSFSMMTVNGVYDISYTDFLTPFIKAGAGYVNFTKVANSPESTPFLDAGAGLKLNITDRWEVKFEALSLFGADYFNILATGGITYAFGRKYDAPLAEKTDEAYEEPKVVSETRTPVLVTAPVETQEPVVITTPEETRTPLVVAPPVIPQTGNKVFTLENIHFASGKSQLSDAASKESIKSYAMELNTPANINKRLIIIGNTDNMGTRSYNATLSLKRANAVRTEFVINQVDPNRITIDGLGEIDPVADNATESGRKKNRRVTLILEEKSTGND